MYHLQIYFPNHLSFLSLSYLEYSQVIISDGEFASDLTAATAASQNLRDAYTQIISIGVGNYNLEQLSMIASPGMVFVSSLTL